MQLLPSRTAESLSNAPLTVLTGRRRHIGQRVHAPAPYRVQCQRAVLHVPHEPPQLGQLAHHLAFHRPPLQLTEDLLALVVEAHEIAFEALRRKHAVADQ